MARSTHAEVAAAGREGVGSWEGCEVTAGALSENDGIDVARALTGMAQAAAMHAPTIRRRWMRDGAMDPLPWS